DRRAAAGQAGGGRYAAGAAGLRRRRGLICDLDAPVRRSYVPAMAIREILVVPNPVLKQVSQPVEKVDDELRALMDDMLETMYAAPGIGLAAIQIGVPKQVIVMDLAREDEEPQPKFFINPEIVWASDEVVPYEEGCLSVPEIYDEVERPARVKVRYLNRDGEKIEED